MITTTTTSTADNSRPLADTNFLLVIAHPDDETLYAGTVFKLTQHLGAKVDVLLITNGEGGFRYSKISEYIYGMDLSVESIAREHLPAIRKREMLNSCKILGIRDVYMLDEKDHRYTRDINELLQERIWDFDRVKNEIKRVLRKREYEAVFVMLPDDAQHAHHKMSCLLALEALDEVYDYQNKKKNNNNNNSDSHQRRRPLVLAGTEAYEDFVVFSNNNNNNNNAEIRYEELTHVVTKEDIIAAGAGSEVEEQQQQQPMCRFTKSSAFVFQFARSQSFGPMNRLNYHLPTHWAMAEHKSQGALFAEVSRQEIEHYWMFRHFTPDLAQTDLPRARRLFELLTGPIITM